MEATSRSSSVQTASTGTSVTLPVKGSSFAAPVTDITMKMPLIEIARGRISQTGSGASEMMPKGVSAASSRTPRRVR